MRTALVATALLLIATPANADADQKRFAYMAGVVDGHIKVCGGEAINDYDAMKWSAKKPAYEPHYKQGMADIEDQILRNDCDHAAEKYTLKMGLGRPIWKP